MIDRQRTLCIVCIMTSLCFWTTACEVSTLSFPQDSAWKEGDHISGLSLQDSYLYFGAGYCLYRLNINNQVLDRLACPDERLVFRPIYDGTYIYSSLDFLQVIAFNMSSGQIVWKFDSPGDDVYAYRYGLKDHTTLVNGRLYAVGHDWLYALDAQTGKSLWGKRNNYMDDYIPFLIYNDLLWYPIHKTTDSADNGMLVAVDLVDGRVKERINVQPRFRQLLSIDSSGIYGLDYGSTGTVCFAVDHQNPHAVTWSQSLPLRQVDQVIRYRDLLVLAHTDQAYVYALDVKTGYKQWSFDGTKASATKPTPSEADVLVFVLKNTLYALDAQTGGMVWQYNLQSFVKGDRRQRLPLIDQGVVYLGNKDAIEALDLSTGNMLWQVEVDSKYRWYDGL